MKSKRQIVEHLGETAYTDRSARKIIGFLLGAQVVAKGEVIDFKRREDDEKCLTFDDFYEWYNNDEEDLEVLGTLLEDLSDAQRDAHDEQDWEKVERIGKQILYLADHLELDWEDEGEEEPTDINED